MNLNKPNYHSWLINQKDFPTEGTIKEKIAFLAGYGVLAPSQHNTQPWSFEIRNDNTLIIKPDTSRALRVGDPHNRGLYIALGACAENIVQAGEQFGLFGTVTVQKSTIHITFKIGMSTRADVGAYITKRHSDKSIYADRPISVSTATELNNLKTGTIELKLVTDKESLQKVKHVHMQAAAKVAGDPSFVKELVGWLRTNKTRAYDGMPGFVSGMSNARAIIGRALLKKKPELFKKALAQDERLFSSAPMVAICGVKAQTVNDFIECGRIIERFWLKAVELGLAVHPLSASVSSASSSKELSHILGMQTVPVFLMRVGYHEDNGLRTPRRSAVCN